MEKHSLKSIAIFCSLLFILSSCFSVKPGTSNSGRNSYETFFVGDEGTQYFIKPLTFENAENEKLLIDITFRYKDEIKDSATVNFSLITKELEKSISSFSIGNSQNQISTDKIKHLFSERADGLFKSRFSTTFSLAEIKALFQSNSWDVNVDTGTNKYLFAAAKSTKKTIQALNDEVFVLF